MSVQDYIGKIGPEGPQRDATHVAVLKLTAHKELYRGDHIGVSENGLESHPLHHIGIVDPFLKEYTVPKGSQFYLWLYPNTVTSLTHQWTHPGVRDASLPYVPRQYTPEESEKWLRKFVNESDCPSYDEVLNAAVGGPAREDEDYGESYENEGDYILFRGRDAHGEIPPEFWYHVENLTGIKIPEDKKATSFSCSC